MKSQTSHNDVSKRCCIYLPFAPFSNGQHLNEWVLDPPVMLATTPQMDRAKVFASKGAAHRYMNQWPTVYYELQEIDGGNGQELDGEPTDD
jgi:hypothetical protein